VSTRCLAHLLFLPSPENSFLDGELEEATTKKFLVVRQEGMRRDRRRLKHYNLDALLSVGGAHKVAGFLCSPDNINPPLKKQFHRRRNGGRGIYQGLLGSSPERAESSAPPGYAE